MNRMAESDVYACDVLIAGAGAAGMAAALAAEGARVIVVAPLDPLACATERAQGGIAAASSSDDAPQLHAADTMRVGQGICRPSAVKMLVNGGQQWIESLSRIGLVFDPQRGLEAGHSRRRIHHIGGSDTGRALARALHDEVRARDNMELAYGETLEAITLSEGRCVGARTTRRHVRARATLLATGGYAGLYGRTTTPASRGEGLRIAYAAGAALADLEFVQFHPTVVAHDSFLLTEALRGAGAILVDARGERFVDELAPRDEVSRAIFALGTAYLDLRPVELDAFPHIVAGLHQLGYDPQAAPIPVAPAAHYTIGGIATDLDGRTSIRGLFAAGEVAATGVHGANRLASNSLLECLVFGARAGRAALDEPTPARGAASEPNAARANDADLGDLLWEGAGIVRDQRRLADVGQASDELVRLIGLAATSRRESRGTHYRADYPSMSIEFAGHLVFRPGSSVALEQWA